MTGSLEALAAGSATSRSPSPTTEDASEPAKTPMRVATSKWIPYSSGTKGLLGRAAADGAEVAGARH